MANEKNKEKTMKKEEQTKKVYQKPVVSKVELVAEQAVLATCKWGTGIGTRDICSAAGDLSCTYVSRS